ncbi:hypothetical protein O181_112330 [Austropuccinia psidii MF-1]|uniref:Uncharacterized protein n=1 Tax=Austropuccinia psidii MF-1 TaxID=1389203 RepID=A0A9Q3PTF5_9BASI|nr:hypothetical protein [Austropuccinia psidii MF-1]
MPTITLELASASPPNPLSHLACLRACTPLQMRLQHCPHLRLHHSLCFHTPTSSSPWLTILTLLRGPQVMPPTPPSPPFTPPCTLLILSAAYHPYTRGLPSQNASDTAYHPQAHSALTLAQSSRPLMILTLLQPPQDETTMRPPISALPSWLLTILMLPRSHKDMPLMPP